MTNPGYIPSPEPRSATQVELYESSNGAEGTTLRGVPCVILTTVGRKSGAVRKAPLMRVTDGEKYAVVASMGGAPKHPVWYLNVRDNPEVRLRDGAVDRKYLAHTASGVERESWWAAATKVWPDYDAYQRKTDREIPIVVLEPIGADTR